MGCELLVPFSYCNQTYMHPSPEKQLTWGLSGGSGYLKLREIGERNLLNPETQVHMCWVSKCWRSGTLYPQSSITAKFWEGCVIQATNISYHWGGCWFSNNELLEIVSAVVPMRAGSICISRELESGVCCGCCDDGMIYMMICIEMLDHELKSFSNWSSLGD